MTYSRVGEMNLFQNLLHPFNSLGKAAFAGALAALCYCLMGISSAQAGPAFGDLRGFTRSAQGTPLPGVQVMVHCVDYNTDLNIVSNDQGAFLVGNLMPGRYELRAAKDGLASSAKTIIDLRPQEDLQVDMTVDASSVPKGAARVSLTAGLNGPELTANSDAAPLTDREKMLLDRLDRLEQRLEAMEAKDVKAGAAPAATMVAEPASVASQPKTSATATAATPSAPVTAVKAGANSTATPATAASTSAPPAAAPVKHVLLASLEGAFGIKSAEKPLALPVPPVRQAAATPAPAATHVLPEALEAPDPAPAVDNVTPFAFADFTWMNGNSRNKDTVLDTKFFTPEVRFDTNFMEDFNQPIDHTMGGATESFRSGEFQLEQISVGGNFHWQNVRGRILTMDGLFATTTPRNDASAGVGQWDVRGAYKYVSEAWGGYAFNVNHGLNVDAGIFVSYIGLFSYYNFDNWTYQPSFVSSNTPWFFNGLRVQWFPTNKLKIEPWIINGWQSYNRYNGHLGLGGQLLWRPKGWFSLVMNQYGYGQDNLGLPHVERIHTDDSIEVKYFDHPKSNGIDKMAFSLTGDLGCQYGPGESCRDLLKRNGLTGDDVAVVIPHQANKRIITAASDRLGIAPGKVLIDIDRYGNTVAGTIPLATRDAIREGRLHKGDIVLFTAVGAGYTVGASIWRWAY